MNIVPEPLPCKDGQTHDGIPMKQCRRCGACLPGTTEYFSRDSKGKNGLLYKCKICSRAAGQDYKKAHKLEMAAYMRDWQQEHLERRADYKKQYRKENHAKVLAGKQRYNAEHPEKKIQSDHKRRSKVRGAGGEYTEDDLAILYVVQEGRCCWRGRQMVNRLIDKEAPRKSKFTVDHINPIAEAAAIGRGISPSPAGIVIPRVPSGRCLRNGSRPRC